MSPPANLDLEQAHRHFSVSCFNNAWGLIDKQNRTPEDDQQMLLLAFASIWHWTQRPDSTDKHLSIGYWQVSRLYSLLDDADNARRYAQLCLDKTPTDDPFCLGYAHEALARAETIAGNMSSAGEHLAQAHDHASAVTDPNDRNLLVDDLEGLDRTPKK